MGYFYFMNLIKEVWLDVKNYEGLYQVSNKGNVRSMDRIVASGKGFRLHKGILLRKYKTNFGYYRLSISVNQKQKTFLVHRLVAEAFIPNPENLPEVNHKDENKLNNEPYNLEWCTSHYNINYGTATHRRKETLKFTSCCKKVIQLDFDGNVIKIWRSASEAGRNGFNTVGVARCARGERSKYKNFKWKYD